MEEMIHRIIENLPLYALFIVIAVTLYTLSKGADWLVEEAVILSVRWGIPKVLIGGDYRQFGNNNSRSLCLGSCGNQGYARSRLGKRGWFNHLRHGTDTWYRRLNRSPAA